MKRFYRHPSGAVLPYILVGCGTEVTQVIVIDPEDHADTQRLAECYLAANPNVAIGVNLVADRLQAALREFANPRAPKPAEPTDPAVRVWANGSEWAKCGPWWVTPAVGEVSRQWDYLVESVGFEILS